MSVLIELVCVWGAKALWKVTSWPRLWSQTTAGTASPSGGTTATPEPPPVGSWLDGTIEGNFILVSVLVGVVMVAAMLYLIRRLTPPHRPKKRR